MIHSYHCEFGTPYRFNLEASYLPGAEIEALEFVNAIPLEWRLVWDDGTCTIWRDGATYKTDLALKGFHDLQARRDGLTRGLPAHGLTLETHGIGCTAVLLWPREGRCKPVRAALTIL